MTLGSPLRFGKYAVEDLLGPGGVTETYRVRRGDDPDEPQTPRFALKLLRADRAGERHEEVASRFMHAADRSAAAAVGGVARVIDISDGDPTFMVTELLTGADLNGVLDRLPLDAPSREFAAAVDYIGARLARILADAHTRPLPLLHEGLGPGNVIVLPSGDVTILDFGVFASVRALTENPIDKWQFVAPEVIGGLPSTPSSDLFGLGVLLHFLIAGQAPFGGESLPELVEAMRQGPPAVDAVPSHLSAIIRALLAFEPRDRPASADEVASWLAAGAERAPGDERAWLAEMVSRPPLPRDGAGDADVSVQDRPAPTDDQVPAQRRTRPMRPTGSPRLVLPVPATPSPPRNHPGLIVFLGVIGAIAAGSITYWLRFNETGSKPAPSSVPRFVPIEIPLTVDAGPRVGSGDEATYIEVPLAARRKLPRVPNHFQAETVPPGAAVWIDGIERGVTPVNVEVGPGGHRILVILEGYQTWRDVVDTTKGEIMKRELIPAQAPIGSAFVNVDCFIRGKFPILIDDQETGLLCPARNVPVPPGKRRIGILIPAERRTIVVEQEVSPGPKATTVRMRY